MGNTMSHRMTGQRQSIIQRLRPVINAWQQVAVQI
jgi:hypothetical protein